MAVRKRGGRWHYDFMIKRTRYRGTIPEARTKAQAEKAEVLAIQAVYEGRYGQPAQSPTFKEFVEGTYEAYAKANNRDWQTNHERARDLMRFFGNYRLDEISPLLIERYKRERLEGKTRFGRKRSPTTVHHELTLLSTILNLAIDYGQLGANPCRKVRKPKREPGRKRYLNAEEETQLMNAIATLHPYLGPIVTLAIYTGMRRGEIYELEWGRVDFSRETITLLKTKSGHSREIPMNSLVRQTLLQLEQGRLADNEFVFTDEDGKPRTPRPRHWYQVCRAAGLVNLNFHDLRHTAATRMAEAGTDAFTIADILGHASIQMSARYTHATDQGRRRAVEAILTEREKDCHKIVTMERKQAG